MGSHPSQTEKISKSSRASQNAGVLEMSRQYPRIRRSGRRPRVAPAVTPSTRPSTPEMIQANSSSHKDPASRWPTTSSTGWR